MLVTRKQSPCFIEASVTRHLPAVPFDDVQHAQTFDGAVVHSGSPLVKADKSGSVHENGSEAPSFSPLMQQRQHQLNFLEVDMNGAVRELSRTRTEFLEESRETLRESHPNAADAFQWIHVVVQ